MVQIEGWSNESVVSGRLVGLTCQHPQLLISPRFIKMKKKLGGYLERERERVAEPFGVWLEMAPIVAGIVSGLGVQGYLANQNPCPSRATAGP